MICLVNPQATRWRYRIPLSILSIGATLEGEYDYLVLDGNVDHAIESTLLRTIQECGIRYVAFTVMPGPQLLQAITLSKAVRARFPDVSIIWGGYFPSLHANVVLKSSYVDYVIRDQGDIAFKMLVDSLERGGSLGAIKGLSYKDGSIHHNDRQGLIDPNVLRPLPYHKVDLHPYIGKTYLGSRTVNYHSSVGCPFLCGFCAVAASYQARWIGLAPERIARDLLWFRDRYHVNAVEFHDNNFFTSERRTYEFSELIRGAGMTWWGEARPDTLLNYDDATWRRMKESGCKMIFMGAESSSTEVLALMEKGGTQTPDTVLALAEKMRTIGIVPEFSFVLGSPTPHVRGDIERDIRFIKSVKRINPESEIVLYVYSPVHFEEADLYHEAQARRFTYPENLDDWLRPEWQLHDLRKNPVTPWLSAASLRRIKNFERVLNGYFPTKSDLKLKPGHHTLLRLLSGWRYHASVYAAPYEIAATHRLLRYRQPEIEGF